MEGFHRPITFAEGRSIGIIDDVKAGWYDFSVTIVTPEKDPVSLGISITFLSESSLERARSESFTALRLIIAAPGHLGCRSLTTTGRTGSTNCDDRGSELQHNKRAANYSTRVNMDGSELQHGNALTNTLDSFP